jgi:hypothetical protein
LNDRKRETAAIIGRGVARVVDIRRSARLLQIRCIRSKNGSRRSGASAAPSGRGEHANLHLTL